MSKIALEVADRVAVAVIVDDAAVVRKGQVVSVLETPAMVGVTFDVGGAPEMFDRDAVMLLYRNVGGKVAVFCASAPKASL